MIYTVTFNPSLDYIVGVENFRAGEINRTSSEKLLPGGKGLNVSMVLSNLGHNSVALGFLAGFTGREIESRMREFGCMTDFIHVQEGFSRINCKIMSDQETAVNGQGPKISRKDIEVLGRKLDKLQAGDILSIIAGPKSAHAFVEKAGMKSRSVSNCMIIGGGTIAYYLARILLDSHIDVTIIEKKPEVCKMLAEELPEANIICGDAANQNVLLEEKIESIESFVSLTGMDEENIFLSLYARRASSRDVKLITKVNRINYDDIIDDMNLGSILNPQKIVAEYIVRYVRAMENSIGSNVETLYNIIENKAEALEFLVQEGAPVIGIPLMQLPLKKDVLVACIYRNRQVIIPNGQTKMEVGDRVIVVTTNIGFQDIRDILEETR